MNLLRRIRRGARYAWREHRRSRKLGEKQRARRRATSRKQLLELLTEFRSITASLGFLAVGGVLLLVQQREAEMIRETRDWPEVPGEVVKATLGQKHIRPKKRADGTRSPGQTLFVPEIHYRFQVDGQPYESNRLSLGPSAFEERNKAEALLRKYREGTKVLVHYSPADPSQSILERSEPRLWAAAPLGWGLLWAGVALSLLSVFNRFRNRA